MRPASAATSRRSSLTWGHMASGREAEAALHGVVVLQVDLEPVLGHADLVALRLADERRRARDRREDAVVKRGRLAGRALERLQLCVDRVADRECAPRALNAELDRCPLDREHLADELREVCDRAAQLAGPDVEERR